MSIEVSKIVQAVEPSATLAMTAKAKELVAAGHKDYNLSVGEPDFKTPQHIIDAAVAAMNAGHTHYTPATGIPQLKEAIVADFQKRFGLTWKPSQCVVSNGAKHALHNAFFATLNPGDEAILPAPCWVSYAELIKLTGATPKIVATTEATGFKLTPDAFRAAITPKTRMLLLCNPSNPTGSCYTKEELTALADVAIENDLFVIADEIYERLVYGDASFTSFPTVREGLQDRVIVINGVSKTYAMTGWRIGWLLAPDAVAKKVASLQSQETSNPCSISQYAALAGITGDQAPVEAMKAEFAKRREYVTQRIADIPGLSAPAMDGAFYAFMNIQNFLGRKYGGVQVDTDKDWCLELLQQKKVAAVFGSAFFAEGYARASFAASMETLERAFDAIAEFVK